MKARFIEPMLLLRTNVLPERENWVYELKLDGYRALGIKSGKKLRCDPAMTMTSPRGMPAFPEHSPLCLMRRWWTVKW